MAADHGWAPPKLLDENVDNGKVHKASGGRDLAGREKLRWAVEEIEAGKYQILAAENFDRLFRNIDVQRQVVGRVERAGGEVWERARRISHKRAADKFTATIKGASSEYVKDTAEERSFDAVEVAIEKGKVPWYQSAPGYIRKKDSTLEPDPKLRKVIKKAFQMRADGAPVMGVRAYLKSQGIERSYNGTRYLLRDRLYVGEIHFGTHTPNLKAHDGIIPRELFDAVQKRRDVRGRRSTSERLLARLGVLRCGTCGSRMVVGTTRQGKKRFHYYRCTPVSDCPRRMTISAEIAEKVVVEDTRQRLEGIEETGSAESEYREAVKDLQEREAALDAAGRAFEGFDEVAGFRDRAREFREAVEKQRERVEALAGRSAVMRTVNADLDWDEYSHEAKRELIQATIARATVKLGRGADRIEIEFVQ
jgi:hypothetical protein